MRYLALPAVLLLAGCISGNWDLHRWKTVEAPASGGSVTVSHGQRLRLPLATKANEGYEWRRVEPQTVSVVAEGPPDPEGISFTPVRSGEEKLRMEYRPIAGGPPQRAVDYVVKVPDDSAFFFRRLPIVLP